jgi:phosphoserine phosphatase RsbU-like protein/GAF domain-containing protein
VNTRLDEFRERYRRAFRDYLTERDEGALSAAYELGREAVGQDLSVLDLAATHHDVLLSAFEDAANARGPEAVTRAAADFFLESLSAFEMVQRGVREAREAAMVERRHAAILRRLSTFLADASLGLDAAGSIDEMLQLVAEHAREVIRAEQCVARLKVAEGSERTLEAVASEQGVERDLVDASRFADLYDSIGPTSGSLRMTAADLARQPAHPRLSEEGEPPTPRGWLAASLTALDERDLGLIQLFDKRDGDFSELDEAVLVQLAQMAAAAVERAQLYRAGR